jgi:hypothetical protein
MNLNFTLPSTVQTYVDQYAPLAQSALQSGLDTVHSLVKEHTQSLHPYAAHITTAALSTIAILAACHASRKASSSCLWGAVALTTGSLAVAAQLGYLD